MERDLRALRGLDEKNICGVAAAVVAASAVSAGAQAYSANKAAKTQSKAANQAAQMQMQMFGQIRDDLTPFRSFGGAALPGLAALLGFGDSYGGSSYDPFFGYNTGGGAAKPAGGFAGVSPLEGSAMLGPYAADGASRRVTLGESLLPDWDAYGAANPDALAWAKAGGGDPSIPIDQQSLQQRLAYHYFNSGMGENRQLPTMAAPQGGAGATGGIQAMLENLPGYQFARDQGMQAVRNALGAKGLGGMSGAYGKGIARFVTGLADSTYGDQVNRLMAAATMGQNAAVQTGSAGLNATSNAGNALLGGAGARAAGTIGVANAISGGLSSIPTAMMWQNMYGGGGAGSSVPMQVGYSGADLGEVAGVI